MNNQRTSAMADRLHISSRRVLQLEALGILSADLDQGENARRYHSYSTHDFDGVCDDLERLARDVDRGLSRLRKAPPSRRAKIAAEIGPLIGRLDRAFHLGNAMAAPAHRNLLTSYTNFVLCAVINEFLTLANLKVADGES